MFRNNNKVPIAKEGFPFIAGFILGGCLLIWIPSSLSHAVGVLFFFLGIFCVFFFRDPERASENDPSFILSPGDGRVLEVSQEMNADLNREVKVVRIFLSIFNVHVQRAPISGIITNIRHQSGKFLDARHPRACIENEHSVIKIENEQLKIVVKQIAGFVARRIVCWVRQGQNVGLGQRLGLIRFGSQVDCYLPQDVDLCVEKGDRVYGGVSVIAMRKSAWVESVKK